MGALGSPKKKAPSAVRPLITPVSAAVATAVGATVAARVAVGLGTAVAAAGVATFVMIGGGKVAVGKTAVSGGGEGETAVSVAGVQADSSSQRGTSHKNRLMPLSIPGRAETGLTGLLKELLNGGNQQRPCARLLQALNFCLHKVWPFPVGLIV